jgi:hypothetical protein
MSDAKRYSIWLISAERWVARFAAMGKSTTTSVRVDDALISDAVKAVEEVAKEAVS